MNHEQFLETDKEKMRLIKEHPANISIKTTSRLHLGFMDLNGSMGSRFGSIGVSLKEPFTQISMERSLGLEITGANDSVARRIEEYVKTFTGHWGIPHRVAIHVHSNIPEHKGLGSGSQMALAVSTGLARLYGLDAGISELSVIGGRGKRSSIGIQSFVHGGLIVDAGKKMDASGFTLPAPPQTLMRMDFPKEWNFVIVIPENSLGLSGEKEQTVIQNLKPHRENSEKICRLVMMKLLPAFISRDIESFGSAISELDRRTGLFFAPAQGGVYSETQSEGLVKELLRAGAYGAGQSSWGPAVYGLVKASESKAVAQEMRESLIRQGIEGEIMTSDASNDGAQVRDRIEEPVWARQAV